MEVVKVVLVEATDRRLRTVASIGESGIQYPDVRAPRKSQKLFRSASTSSAETGIVQPSQQNVLYILGGATSGEAIALIFLACEPLVHL